eukprot:12204672-Karenia_brevis.AAC.1
MLAVVGQQALNAGKHVATQSSELEVACIIEEYIHDPTMTGLSANQLEDQIASTVADRCVPSQAYTSTLYTYTRMYGGGKGAPVLHFMGSVAEDFQGHYPIGAEI